MNLSFWATIERPDPANGRVQVHRSGIYGTSSELQGWVRNTIREGDVLKAYRREGGKDIVLNAPEEPVPDRARWDALVVAAYRSLYDAPVRAQRVLPRPKELPTVIDAETYDAHHTTRASEASADVFLDDTEEVF